MPATAIDIQSVAGALGAEVRGADLARPLDAATVAAVHAAFLDHGVLFFPDQSLSVDTLMAFGRRFGDLLVHPFLPHDDEHPEVMVLDKAPEARGNIGNGWHTDMSFLAEPPAATALFSLIVPEAGGDTLFADMYAAHDALSEGMRTMLGGLTAVHDYRADFRHAAGRGITSVDAAAIEAAHDDYPPAVHPVLRTHPETRRKALYVNRLFTQRFDGMSEEESRPILDYLFDHLARPEFTCRHRWAPGTLALWDNRRAQHYAINDYFGHRRLMHRVTITGDRPI